ncbi:zinc ribbon domain-containing protein [Fibrobacter sp.]|uniref:zinc ribbon domain-containing protein n=1 Tax=Fibrobacter sp. TaxID=35828 RepID=UPI00388D7EF9
MNCPKCNAKLEDNAKFCSNCGAEIPAQRKNSGAGVSIGDKNVIAGDVSITNVNAQDETKLVNECHVCGKHVTNDQGHTCPECGQFTCNVCFDKDKKMCGSCVKEKHQNALKTYRSIVSKIFAKGVVSVEDRNILEKESESLGLTNEEAASIESGFRNDFADLTDADKIVLEECQKNLLDGEFEEAEKIKPIYEKYPDNPDVFACCVRMIAKSDNYDKDKVESLIKQLKFDNRDAQMALVELAMINGDFSKANRLIEDAKKKWSSDYLVSCYEIILYCLFVNKKHRPEYLNKIHDVLNNLGKPTNIFEKSCEKFTKYLCGWIEKWKDGEDEDADEGDFDSYWDGLWSVVDFSNQFLAKKVRKEEEKERKRNEKKWKEEWEREQQYEEEKRKREEEKRALEEAAAREKKERRKKSIALTIPFGFLIPTIIIEGIVFTLANLISFSEMWLYIAFAVMCVIVAVTSVTKEKIKDKLMCHLAFWGPFFAIEALSIGIGYLILNYCFQSLLFTIVYVLIAILCLLLGLKFASEACDDSEKILCFSGIAIGILCIGVLIAFHIFGEIEFWTIWTIPFSILSLVIAGIILKEFLEKRK